LAELVDKDDAIRDFLASLKVTLKTGTIYQMGHPAFQRAAEDLLSKITRLLEFSNPLSIGFTPDSLFLDNRFWESERTVVDLARIFHFRKIKTLEIREGISLDELMKFVSKLTLSLQEFIKEGGARKILEKEKILHITVEELAYSQLLKGEWEEIKDIWVYLLIEAVQENNREKLDHVAEIFERAVGGLNTEDVVQNEELQRTFYKFFTYLKGTQEDKYRNCSKSFLKTIMAGRRIGPEPKMENLRLLVSEMGTDDLASTIWEEILFDDKFDSLSFSIFSRVIDKERHAQISTSLRELFQSDNPLNRKPEVEQKIRALLSGKSGAYISEIYRQTLNSLLGEIKFEKRILFDHHLLRENYRYGLLNALAKETQPDDQARYLERIQEEWNQITGDKDLEYVKNLLEVLPRTRKDLGDRPAYQNVRRSISELIENMILAGENLPDFDSFIKSLKESVFERKAYLEKIFKEKIVTPPLLAAFFGFFTQYLFEFNARLKQKAADSPFLANVADSLKFIDTRVSLVTLKSIFLLGDVAIKFRALKSMENLTVLDQKFLFRILDSKNPSLRAEALTILIKDEHVRLTALERLLSIESPYGLRNRKLLRNIKLVEDMDIREAWPFLKILNRRKNFWNRKVRETTSRILEKWGER
jgi:hypothetical protein